MRLLFRSVAACLFVGFLVTIAVSWALALWQSPAVGAALNPLLMAKLRREYFERPGVDPGGSDPGQLFVRMGYATFGAQFFDVSIDDRDIPSNLIRGPLPSIGVVRSGWPRLALEGQWWHDAAAPIRPPTGSFKWAVGIPNRFVAAGGLMNPRMLPFRPMWPGFAIDVAAFAMVAALPLVGRAVYRKVKGRCMVCGYPIGVSNTCTECGAAVRSRKP